MYQRILVPIDGSPTSRQGLDEAIRLAACTHGRLLLLHAVDDMTVAMALEPSVAYVDDWYDLLKEGGARLLADARAVAISAGIEVDTVLSESYAQPTADGIVAEATRWKADLIVIGTHGRRGIGRVLLGSTAEAVVRSSPVPVLLIRGTDLPAPAGRSALERAIVPDCPPSSVIVV